MKKIEVKCKNNTFEAEEGVILSKLLKNEIEKNEYKVVGAKVNNQYEELDSKLTEDCNVELLDVSMKEGTRIYRKTLIYIMGKAFKETYPDALITVDYQLANQMYCEIDNMEVTDEIIENVKAKMREIINRDLKIEKVEMTREEARKFFDETGTIRGKLQYDLIENKKIYMYFCEDYYNYCYEVLGNRTSCTQIFDLVRYSDGFLIRYPTSSKPGKLPKYEKTRKLAWALDEYNDIYRDLEVNTVYKLNKAVEEDRIKEVILLAEALHEKNIVRIADKISQNKKIKMILIAGPSSSGKTTFAQRLGLELRLNGLKPVTLSVDNYFVEREQTPLDENGEYDFESIDAIDRGLFNEHIEKLINGEEVEIPEFNFSIGAKEYKGKKMKLEGNEILIMEGIHCLNDKLTALIPQEQKFKIYISALTVLNMDYYNRISTTDTRLIRRILRDYKFRGYTAQNTISRWKKVNIGEEKNIFPYQEDANVIFNTSLIYELGVLKPYVQPLLEGIGQEEPEFADAQRLINILKYFKPIPAKYIPNNSLLKEFVGGGSFKY